MRTASTPLPLSQALEEFLDHGFPLAPSVAPISAPSLHSGQALRSLTSDPCPRCKGYGFVVLDVEPGHKLFGKALRCSCQDEAAKAARIAYLSSVCRVPARYRGVPCDRENVLAAIAASARRRQFITVTGAYGVGKTTLLCGAVQAATGSLLTGVYVLMSELLDHLRRAYAPDSSFQADRFWEAILEADVLAIDELDRFKATEWAEQKLFELLNARYNRDRGLTLFATNRQVHPGMTEGIIDERPGYLESRLFEQGNLILALTGPDLRRGQGVTR